MYRIAMPGFVMHLHGDNYLENEIIQAGQWESSITEFIRHTLQRGMTAIDVGANIGYFSLLMASLVGTEGEVHAFEPYPGYAERMRLNLAANIFSNIYLNELALSSQQEERELFKGLAYTRMCRSLNRDPLFGMEHGRLVVPCISLDDYAAAKLKRLDLIKIDVDGFEMGVLQGAQASIEKYHPIIVVELRELGLRDVGSSAAEVLDLFRSWHYHAYSEQGETFRYGELLDLVTTNPELPITAVFRTEIANCVSCPTPAAVKSKLSPISRQDNRGVLPVVDSVGAPAPSLLPPEAELSAMPAAQQIPSDAGLPKSKPPQILWQGPIYEASGYADEVRNFISSLHRQEFELGARAIGRRSETFQNQLDPDIKQILDQVLSKEIAPGFISVIHSPAHLFRRLPHANYHIGRVMFETDGLPAGWEEKCKQMDEIWVPSRFNLQTFRDAGVTTKMIKVPSGINTEIFRPGVEPLPIPGARGTIFLSIFAWIYRKGWDVLLRAWAKAFAASDDVTLVLRTHPINATNIPNAAQEIEQHINHYLQETLGLKREEVAPIIVLGEQVPEQDLPRLHAAANAYVAPSRGEGWGRPQMQAMACGLPVIATAWGGNLEFMTEENSLLLDIEGLVEIDERAEIPFYQGQRWAEPSEDHLVTLLRRVRENPMQAEAIGRRARQDMVESWQWHKVAEIPAKRLRTLQASLATRADNYRHDGTIALRWEGAQFVTHSFALINREVCLRMAQDPDLDLSIIPSEPHQFGAEADPRFAYIANRLNWPLARPAQVHVRHQWPPNLTPPPEGHWVMIQPWEFGSIPETWIKTMHEQVDQVWAYTTYVRDCYIQSGLPDDRVCVVPPGVDIRKFSPDQLPFRLNTKKRFKFLFVGNTISRKGIDILLDVYTNTFTGDDDVCLVVKDMGGAAISKGQTAREIIAELKTVPNTPEIEYLNQTLTDERLAGLYTACDCLVQPYRGEGFALPIAEAMAAGLPVMVTDYGAALDFCSDETAFLIPAEVVRFPDKRIGDLETVDYPWWAEPDRHRLGQLMRDVVAGPGLAIAKAATALAFIRANFTWDHTAETIKSLLKVLHEQPIRRFETQTPANESTSQPVPPQVEAAQAAGDWNQAVTLLTTMLNQPNTGHEASLWNSLGYTLFQAGQIGEAEQAFQRGLTVNPDNLDLLSNLADLYLQQERFDNATEYLNRALRLDPYDINVLMSLGHCSIQLEALDVALMAFRRGQSLAPETEGIDEIIAQLEALAVDLT